MFPEKLLEIIKRINKEKCSGLQTELKHLIRKLKRKKKVVK
jgi:hypothetical protein